MAQTKAPLDLSTESLVTAVLQTIDREREREIVARRFGLFERKETLEQIGEMLGITRERVRQLEKSVVTKLRSGAEQGTIPNLAEFQDRVVGILNKHGEVARISLVTSELNDDPNREEQSRVSFLCQLCPDLTVIQEDDNFYYSVAIMSKYDEKTFKSKVEDLVDATKKLGEPRDISDLAKAANITDGKAAAALASTSKKLATLNNRWGLVKWPMVNPKNIKDKIYVILKENGKHMHFNEIAEAIKDSDFKRKDVTTQAIHNELIKDKRFVLIGRGIYALKEWGYEKGTVADIITEVLKEANEPLHRDEIVKRVLKSRFVKETTILLNLQGKPQFKRVAKATYALAE
ncbi:MAG TPA: sigma factor-like helix-turn-helix DNA-binding protein [Candidatus Saccharimonadales bacterium]|nr:sigma factor-like helix-turn-helix DNA-binding protein [Candidatus Saccharimonadales bacterium]